MIRNSGLRPKPIDGRLLAVSRTAIGVEALNEEQKEQVRTAFFDVLSELEEEGATGDG